MHNKIYIYSFRDPREWGFEIERPQNTNGHRLFKAKEKTIISPQKLTADFISPQTIDSLKNELKIKTVLFIDALKNVEDIVEISDHTNRSGINLLKGKTPFKDLPRFPDMSHVYNPIQTLDKAIVHTIGPDRFKAEKSNKTAWSETAGIITPVLHYCGINVWAVGCSLNQNHSLKTFVQTFS